MSRQRSLGSERERRNHCPRQGKTRPAQHLAVNFGVVGLPNNEAESRKVFRVRRKMGIRTITSEPGPKPMT
jgi:hypothetical protein